MVRRAWARQPSTGTGSTRGAGDTEGTGAGSTGMYGTGGIPVEDTLGVGRVYFLEKKG